MTTVEILKEMAFTATETQRRALENAISALSENKGDLISRKAALDSLKEHMALYCDNTPESFSKLSYAEKSRVDELDTAIATIINLPSVENKGEWIYDKGIYNWRCSRCGQTPPPTGYAGKADFMATHFKFCSHCGAEIYVKEQEINTIRPKMEIPGKDEKR